MGKKCSKCRKTLSLSNFYLRPDRKKYESRCKRCKRIYQREWRTKWSNERRKIANKATLDSFYKHAEYNVKRVIQHKISGWKNRAKMKEVSYDLTVDYLVKLWNEQEGRCYYTGRKMNFVPRRGRCGKTNPDNFSLDRLNPNEGYVKGNVKWCCWIVNTSKNLMTEREFYEFCKLILKRAISQKLYFDK